MCSPDPYPRRQLSDVTSGLCYPHFRAVIHGDLRAVRDYYRSRLITVLILGQENVGLGPDGHARIADFRFAILLTWVGQRSVRCRICWFPVLFQRVVRRGERFWLVFFILSQAPCESSLWYNRFSGRAG